jgi:Protein of unknown function (DUF3618)
MDEQNPSLKAERMSGRGDDMVTGYSREERSRVDAQTSNPQPGGRVGTASASETLDPASAERTREIRAEIAHTRDELSETVNAIQDRLRPSTMASNAAESVKRAAVSRAREARDSEPVAYVRANPIPTVMVGIGIAGAAWLAMAGRDSEYTRRRSVSRNRDWQAEPVYRRPEWDNTYETDRFAASGSYAAYETTADYNPDLSRPRAYASQSARSSSGAGLTDRVARVMPDRRMLQRTWDGSPLLIGAASLLAGAIVGLSVPETEREHQLMGETRDSLVDSVQDTVRDKVNEVQQAATDAVSKVQNAAAGVVGMSGEQGSKNNS